MAAAPVRESPHENALETWARRCAKWRSVLDAAQEAGDLAEIAKAELGLAICERERARVEALFARSGRRSDRAVPHHPA